MPFATRAVSGRDPDAAPNLSRLGRALPGMWQDTRRLDPIPLPESAP